jgi:outer membrane protein OmpA-like peptidoglycan-associated protein
MIRAKSTLALSLAALLGLTACDEGPRTQAGAGIGAVIGGLFGAGGGGGGLGRTAAGAVVGGVIGGAIGQALDRQAGDLRSAMGDDVTIVNTGSELVVTMPNDILFATDSATVSSQARADLAALAGNLRDYPDTIVEVIGHTDNVGEAGYNLSLSRRRAASVASELFAGGVASSRVVTIGKGEDEPVASNLTPEGRQQNRRVVVVIRPTA